MSSLPLLIFNASRRNKDAVICYARKLMIFTIGKAHISDSQHNNAIKINPVSVKQFSAPLRWPTFTWLRLTFWVRHFKHAVVPVVSIYLVMNVVMVELTPRWFCYLLAFIKCTSIKSPTAAALAGIRDLPCRVWKCWLQHNMCAMFSGD